MSYPLYNWECQVECPDGRRQELLVFGQPTVQLALKAATGLLEFVIADTQIGWALEIVFIKRLSRSND